jgi:hypothetical protein
MQEVLFQLGAEGGKREGSFSSVLAVSRQLWGNVLISDGCFK